MKDSVFFTEGKPSSSTSESAEMSAAALTRARMAEMTSVLKNTTKG